MKVYGKDGIGSFLKVLLQITFIIGIPITLMLPFIIKINGNLIVKILFIYPICIFFLFFVYQFIKLFNSLKDNNPFNYNNVKTLKKASYISLIMSAIWIINILITIFIIKNTYINYILVLLFLTLLFFGVFIALYILSELLNNATKYKEENDLTI